MIREAKEKDLDKILELLVQVNMLHHNLRPDLFKGPATKYNREELLAMLTNDKRPIFVYTDDTDNVYGYLIAEIQQVRNSELLVDNKTMFIDDICIDENKRNQKFGKHLYEYAVSYAKRVGCHNIVLNVWEGNFGAACFYREMGLKPQKTVMEQIL